MTLAFDSAKFSSSLRAGGGAHLLREAVKRGVSTGVNPEKAHWYGAVDARDRDLGIYAADEALKTAWDAAQSELVTTANAGIPYFLANLIVPGVIPALVSPMKAAQIVGGETQRGSWLEQTVMFLQGESTGETSVYGDYSNDGISNANVNYPQRQNFIFQAYLRYGQRELGMAGLAGLDWAAQQQAANALTLAKQLNDIYFYGVANLENYGLLNDPALPPPIAPTYSWLSSSATAYTIYQDVVRLYQQLQEQTNGVVELDADMTLALSPLNEVPLKNVTQYMTKSVEELLKTNFPNLKVETAVQYSTSSGQLVQLVVNSLDGVQTAECAYSSKMMAHNLVTESSSWKQKRSSGGYGTVIRRPMLIASMLG